MLAKKGDYTLGHKIFFAIVFVVFIALLFSYAHSLFMNHRTRSVDNSLGLEAAILVNMLVSDPGCYAYYDVELDRIYPGVIDFEKTYKEIDIEKCLRYLPEGYKVDIFLEEFGELYSNAPAERPQTVVEKNVFVRSDTAVLPAVLVLSIYHDEFLLDNLILRGNLR